MLDVALATSAAFPELGPHDRGVLDALRKQGIRAAPAVWNDRESAWTAAGVVVIQSTWDSHIDPAAFLTWAAAVDRTRTLLNPLPLLQWNLHKSYLAELADRGIAVTPTEWRGRGESVDLAALMKTRQWDRAVLKPAVAASAYETHVVSGDRGERAQAIADRLLRDHDVLIQPYLESFESEGERSYIFFEGEFSHAVRRPPTLASARRGFSDPVRFAPDPAELALARSVLGALDEEPLYARVDMATNNDGVLRLQELELVEPCLFTSLAEGAAARFAGAIAKRL